MKTLISGFLGLIIIAATALGLSGCSGEITDQARSLWPGVQVNSGASADELQEVNPHLSFNTAGHVLSFLRSGVVIASPDCILKVDFLNAKEVKPAADTRYRDNAGTPLLSWVTYTDVWEGVTIIYEASEDSILKTSYQITNSGGQTPGGNIRLGYNHSVSIDEYGNLIITFENGALMESAPTAYQWVGGKRHPVSVAYKQYNEKEIGFHLSDVAPDIPVVIDPELTWNTYTCCRQR